MPVQHPDSPHVLALDFGGTKLIAAVVDTARGEILSSQRQPTPIGASASIETMFALGRAAVRQAGIGQVARVGISFGGPVSVDRQHVLVSNHVSDWEGIALPRLAAEAFGCPAAMENDANAAALGAWAYDTGREPNNMAYIQVSTGVGGGLILNRSLYRGNALAAEVGHWTMQPGGPACTCGKNGCLESLCSGWAIARDGRSVLPTTAPGSPLAMLCEGSPDRLDARLVLEAARQGDPLAAEVANRAFTALGIAIANVIALIDPEVVVLGGGIMRAEDLVRAVVEPVLERETPPMFRGRCKLQFSRLDGSETLFGAALLEGEPGG